MPNLSSCFLSPTTSVQDHMGSAGHSRALWGVTTLVVIGYSYLLATILPFFSELVSICRQNGDCSWMHMCPKRGHSMLLAVACTV